MFFFHGLTRLVPPEGSKLRRQPQGLQPRSWLSVGATCDVTFFQGTKNHTVMIHSDLDSIATHPQKLPGILKRDILQESLPVSSDSSFSFSEFIQCPALVLPPQKQLIKPRFFGMDFFFRAPGIRSEVIKGTKKSKSKANLPKFNGNLRGNPTPPSRRNSRPS